MNTPRIRTDFEYESARLSALVSVMAKTNWTCRPQRLRHWRATVETTGFIIGLEDLGELTLFATDGVLGLFKRHSTGRVDTYHTHRPANAVHLAQEQLFTGKITPLIQKPKRRAAPDTDADGNVIIKTKRTKVKVSAQTARKSRIDILNSL